MTWSGDMQCSGQVALLRSLFSKFPEASCFQWASHYDGHKFTMRKIWFHDAQVGGFKMRWKTNCEKKSSFSFSPCLSLSLPSPPLFTSFGENLGWETIPLIHFIAISIACRQLRMVFRQWQKWKLFTPGPLNVFLLSHLPTVKKITYWWDWKTENSSPPTFLFYILFLGWRLFCLPKLQVFLYVVQIGKLVVQKRAWMKSLLCFVSSQEFEEEWMGLSGY